MKNANIMIINAQLTKFNNNTTGEITEMTKVTYAIPMSHTENFVGNAVLECYKRGNSLKQIEEYIMQKVSATIEERPTKNGSKYVLTKINNKEI